MTRHDAVSLMAIAGMIAILGFGYATLQESNAWAGSATAVRTVVLAIAEVALSATIGGTLGWWLGRRSNEDADTMAIGGGAAGILVALILW